MDKLFHKNAESVLSVIKFAVSVSLVFLFPFFFLNLTQEYFVTNKLYLLGFGVLLLILISTIQILISKKISWQKQPFDNLILLFLTAMAISVVFASPNKIQALLNPNFGLVMMVALAVLCFYLSRFQSDARVGHARPLQLMSIILSLVTIVFYFQPFKNIVLPQNLTFLKNPAFTPVGSQLDLAILLGFFTIIGIVQIIKQGRPQGIAPTKEQSNNGTMKQLILNSSLLILNLLALFLTVYSLIRAGRALPLQLPPFRLSWFAALEVLKNPQTAVIGIGPDNFSAIFTRVKDFAYNQSSFWQINSFNVSRSAILQILTETGILGLLAFGLLIFNVFKQLVRVGHARPLQNISLFVYLIICLFVFPPSLIVWFLFFIVISQIKSDSIRLNPISTDLTGLLPIYLGIVIISFGFIGASGYFLGRSYASEYFFKKSIDGVAANSVKQVYDNQRQAIILNPFIERFHGSFAQTNLLIANNLSLKNKDGKITEQDRQTIAQAIQAAIAEGKAAVSLNPQKADGWQNLASIYQNVINAAAGADVWTISAYQRAIIADPQNPVYRVGLGGVYYSLNKYDDAAKFFEQAVSLKPDWPNANYNYAWANFQIKNYPQAVNALQATLKLVDPKLNKADYEKVQKELEEFKKMLPKEESQVDQSGEKNQPGSLNLPTPPAAQISPKLELPKEASPEAK